MVKYLNNLIVLISRYTDKISWNVATVDARVRK